MVRRVARDCSRALVPCAMALLLACGGERAGTGVPQATVLSPPPVDQRFARFSPDGKHVAYGQSEPGAIKLMVAAADLSGARMLDSEPAGVSRLLWSPDGASLAYQAGPGLDIWVAPVSGGAPRQLTTGKGIEIPIQWHPHGDRLAFLATSKGGGIGEGQIDVATGATKPILGEKRPAMPFWSPDGSMIAYQLLGQGKNTLWVADSMGQHTRQLTTEGFEQFPGGFGDPWSPDGSQLLYESRRTGFADVWVIPVNGDSARQLTRDVRNDYNPRWSPDGRWVAFLSDRGRQTDIWVVPAVGGSPQRVTDNDQVEGDVQWLPGTSEIGFSAEAVHAGLWTHSLADGSEHRLTPDSIQTGADDGTHDLSPDGKSVVFQNLRGGGVSDLDLVPVSGGSMRTVVANGAWNRNPEWSPDGSKVLYISDKSGTLDAWVVSAAGGEPTDVTAWPTDEHVATWSKDGASIYVVSSRDAKPFADLWEVPVSGGEPRRVTRDGTVQDVIVSRASGDVLVRVFSGSEGQISLGRVLPSGRLQMLWDRSSVLNQNSHWFTPSGDSVAFVVQAPDGPRPMLMPTHGGPARPILSANTGVGAWSPDGTRLVYWAPYLFSDLYLESLADGKTQRLTNNTDDEGGVFWLPNGLSILFYRASHQTHIATVNVGTLIEAKQ
jgi:Tol biopolymer transport system component